MEKLEEILSGKYKNHILPFLWMKGESQEKIREYMRIIHDSHIDAVCLESRPHPHFLEDQWWKDVRMVLDIAKKYNMKVWVLDDSHFPSGYANGEIKKHPHLKKQYLKHKRIEIVGPKQSVGVYVKPYLDENADILSIYAKSENQWIDLSENKKDEIIYFSLPKGIWQIYIIYTSTQGDFRDDYINMIDRESCRLFIDTVYEEHYKHFHNDFGETFAGFFSDEPGFQNEKGNNNDSCIGKKMALPWSKELSKRLKENLGEQYLLELSALWYEEHNSPKIRYIYMDLCTQLYDECFTSQIGNWCREHHVEYIGHVIEDRDSNSRLGVGAGNIFRSMYGQDMAGVDIVLNQIVPGLTSGNHPTFRGEWDSEFFHYVLVKLSTSLAHIDPKKKGRTVAEVFGAFGWSESIRTMKWIIDHFLVRGVNYFVPHAFSMKEFPDPDCPPHFYAHGINPQFPYFQVLMDYTNKMCNIFSNGITQSDVAVLYHADAEWTGQYMLTQKVTRELTRHQVDFDILPQDVFMNNSYFSYECYDNCLKVHNQKYKALLIPYCEYISDDLYNFIINTKNFKIIFVDNYPKATYTYQKVQFQKKANIFLSSLENLWDYIQENKLNSLVLNQYCPDLRLHHYVKNDLEVLMAFNENPNEKVETILKQDTLKPIYKIDLLSKQIEKIEGDIHISLYPYESCLYLIGENHLHIFPSLKVYPYLVQEINKNIKLSLWDSQKQTFIYQKTLERLENLSLQKHFPHYSGTFRYEVTFEIQEKGDLCIDLGEVQDGVSVMIDGECVGKCICPPYHFFKDDVEKGQHQLIIDVSNTLDKQFMDIISSAQEIQPTGILNSIFIKKA